MNSRPWYTSRCPSCRVDGLGQCILGFCSCLFFFGLTKIQVTGRKADQSGHCHMARTCQNLGFFHTDLRSSFGQNVLLSYYW